MLLRARVITWEEEVLGKQDVSLLFYSDRVLSAIAIHKKQIVNHMPVLQRYKLP